MTRTDDLKSVPDDPINNSILSEKDELKLQKSLNNNKKFILDLFTDTKDTADSTSNNNSYYNLPKYIGTDELEFNKFRKLSLISKRLKKKKLNNLKLSNTKNTNKEISEEKFKSDEKIDENSPSSTPQPDSPIPTSSKLSTPISQSQPQTAPLTKWSLVVQNSLPNKSSIASKSNTHSSTPSAYTSASTSSSTTTTITTSATNTPTTTTTTTATTNGSIANGTSTKSTSSSPNQSTAEIISQKSSSQSTIPMDNTLKPLGLILLRVMYDKYLLPSCILKGKNLLVSPHGLTNNGSICFMNSILQLLFCCEPFIQILNLIRDGTLASFESNKTPVLDATINLLNLFKSKKEHTSSNTSSPSPSSTSSPSSSYDIISPNNFYTAISKVNKFSHLKWGRQEDAEEFLGYFLDSLHEEFIESIKNLKDTEIEKLLKSINDRDTKRNVTQALEIIRSPSQTSNNSSTTTTTTSKEETNDDDGWHEVGSNRKIVAKREVEVKPSPIVQLFGGQFRSVLSVSNSKKSSITLDPFMHVQLDISDNETTDLISAFNKFSEIEEISYGNQMAKKQNFIDKLPMILIIHLKRFSYVTTNDSNNNNNDANNSDSNNNNSNNNNSNISINNNDSNIADSDDKYEVITRKKKSNNSNSTTNNTISSPPSTSSTTTTATPNYSSIFEGRIEKLHKIIKYDHELKLPKNCISPSNYFNPQQPPNYKLTGVVYHHGRSAEGGHYTVDVLNQNEWFRVDDTQVTKINKSDVIENGLTGGNYLNNNKSAYILMYQRI
ncbi:peptidase activity protein [[Candida] boidinii]|nr:peptidase activity protein [[Candida] boidinii]OWB86070.1 peptidase activity protein [[Candida] boidinii]